MSHPSMVMKGGHHAVNLFSSTIQQLNKLPHEGDAKRKHEEVESDSVASQDEPLYKMALTENWSDRIKTVIREEIKTSKISAEDNKSAQLEPPEFLKTISDCNVMEGQPAHFVYTLKPSNCVTNVQWFRNNEPVEPVKNKVEVISDGNEAGCLIISQSASENSGIYKVLASNEKGSTQCRATLVVGSEKEIATVDKSSQSLVDREMQTEEVEVAKNKRKISDHSSDDETSRKQMKDEIEDDYLLEAPIFTKELSAAEVKHGDKVRLKCLLKHANSKNITWFKDGKELSEKVGIKIGNSPTKPYLEIKKVKHSDFGEYSVTAANECGEVTCSAFLRVIGR